MTVSQRGVNWLAVGYLIVLLALDVRFGLGVWGLVLALGGFVAIVACLDLVPRMRTRLRRSEIGRASCRERV